MAIFLSNSEEEDFISGTEVLVFISICISLLISASSLVFEIPSYQLILLASFFETVEASFFETVEAVESDFDSCSSLVFDFDSCSSFSFHNHMVFELERAFTAGPLPCLPEPPSHTDE